MENLKDIDIKVVIVVNKTDLWFCRICVGSIRFYYPYVQIYIIKDELNGRFSTIEMEKLWGVEVISYSIKKFGWSAGKIHFYCDEKFKNQKFLVLDADIVFSGRILDQMFLRDFEADVIVNYEKNVDPYHDWFAKTIFDLNTIQNFDPMYKFPFYTFNCGQLFCRGAFLKPEKIAPFFNFDGNPSWTRTDIFPLVDQSVFNYLLPRLEQAGELKIGLQKLMLWSEAKYMQDVSFEKILQGVEYPYVIHWAGALRTPYLEKMRRSDILTYFEDFYYSKVRFSIFKRKFRRISHRIYSLQQKILRKLSNR